MICAAISRPATWYEIQHVVQGTDSLGLSFAALDERVGGFAIGTRLTATARTSGHRVVYPLKTFVACAVGVRIQKSRSNVNCGLIVVYFAGSMNCSP